MTKQSRMDERVTRGRLCEEGKVEGDIKISGPVDSLYFDVPEKLSLAGKSADSPTRSSSLDSSVSSLSQPMFDRTEQRAHR